MKPATIPLFFVVVLSLVVISLAVILSAVPMAAQSESGLKFRNAATLDVSFLSQDPDPVEPGAYTDLRFKVENLGIERLPDVVFDIDLDYPFYLNDPSERVKRLGDVGTKQAGDDSIIIMWRVLIDENAPEGAHEVLVNYFINDVGVKLSPFAVNVKSRQALLAVDKIEITPPNPEPGDLINVRIFLRNAVDTTVQDVKVQANLEGTKLAAVGSTNEKVVKRIFGGETVEIPFQLAVDANAEAKVHQIPLRIEYANRFNDVFVLNTSFGCMVGASSDYLVNLEETSVYIAGSKGEAVISISNIGKSDLNFMALELMPTEEYAVLSAPQVYLGNLESDDFETGEFEIFVKKSKSKQVNLQVKVRYKDAYNAVQEKELQVPLRLYSKSEAKQMGLDVGGGGIGGILLVIILILGIVDWRRKWSWINWIRKKVHLPAEDKKKK